ncbi:Protein phosphatase 2C 7 [Thecaphora frezii]
MERYLVKRTLTQAPLKPLLASSHQHGRAPHQRQRPQPSPAPTAYTSSAKATRSLSHPLKSTLTSAASSTPHSATSTLSASAPSPLILGSGSRYPSRSPLVAYVQPALGRSLTTTAQRSSKTPFQFLTAYAFAGKPRYLEEEQAQQEAQQAGQASQLDGAPPRPSSKEASKIGFPADSDVGRWRDSLLSGGEAGEDALLCTNMANAGDKAIGVADGVGGWTESGVDPSLFSQSLMYYASTKAEASSADPDTAADGTGAAPKAILADAFDNVLREPLVVAGSATACILTLDSISGTLRSANLGDSGFIVLRQGKGKHGVLFASPPQQLGFNTPLQLAKLPIEMRQEGSISNMPKDAATWECKLQHGDLIIVGTDGLFDNVDARVEIPQFAKFIKEKHHAKYMAHRPQGSKEHDSLDEDQEFVEVLATNLVEYAKICQNSQTKQSPFEREAARYGIHFPGGKVDDVALVCCLVIET